MCCSVASSLRLLQVLVQRDMRHLLLSLTGHTRSDLAGPPHVSLEFCVQVLPDTLCEYKKQRRKEGHTWLLCSHLLRRPLKRSPMKLKFKGKMIKNFESAAVEHDTKHRPL